MSRDAIKTKTLAIHQSVDYTVVDQILQLNYLSKTQLRIEIAPVNIGSELFYDTCAIQI